MSVVSEVAAEIGRVIGRKGRAIVLLDGDPGLGWFYRALAGEAVEWTRVIGLQTGEILAVDGGSEVGAAQRLLLESLVTRVPMAEFHPLRAAAASPEAVCGNYEALLGRRPPDLAIVATRGAWSGVRGDLRRGYVLTEGAIVATMATIESCERVLVVGSEPQPVLPPASPLPR